VKPPQKSNRAIELSASRRYNVLLHSFNLSWIARALSLAAGHLTVVRSMRCLFVLLIGCLALGSTEAQVPAPSADRIVQFKRELAQLEKTFFDDQRKGDQFGDHFWRESKQLANHRGTDIIPAVATYCRKWHGEEPLIFVPLVALLPRSRTLAILREIERSGEMADRGFAHEFLIELDMSDTKEAVRRYSQ
jgi:hypothetical protein